MAYASIINHGDGTFSVTGSSGGTFNLGIATTFNFTTPSYQLPAYVPWIPTAPTAIAASTGVNPIETSYSLYGHIVPLSVFGVGRIGGEIISGPWVENGLASFIISFGVPADPSGTRDIREIAFDSEVVWSTGGTTGVTTSAGGTFTVEAFTFRFYQGTLSQAADTLESTHFGADAVAYRPQILLAFSNLPLAGTKFGKIPYVAAVIGDGTGDDVNLGEAFERLAYSPWVGYTSSQFETSGITDGLVNGGLIIAQDSDFLSTIQQFGRFYSQWDILQTDKLRIVDRGAVMAADINLTAARLTDRITVNRQGADTVKKDLELATIDPDADYTIVPSVAQLPRFPVAVTTSVGKDSAYLPAIMDASTRISIVTLTKYHEEATRKTISGTAMAYGLEIEPGALVALLDIDDDFTAEVFKVVETLHGANYVVEFTAAAILRCTTLPDAYFAYVVLLLGFEGVDGSQGAPGFTDESPFLQGTGTPVFGSAVDTATSKFGSSSALMDGSVLFSGTDYHLSAANSDQFTVECWVKFISIGAGVNVLFCTTFVGTDWYFGAVGPGAAELTFGFRRAADGVLVTTTTSGAAMTTGVWYFVACDKDSAGKIRLYVNGVPLGSATPADSNFQNVDNLMSLGSGSLGGGFELDGWLDEVRITKGIARYQTDVGFTPPTDAFPRA